MAGRRYDVYVLDTRGKWGIFAREVSTNTGIGFRAVLQNLGYDVKLVHTEYAPRVKKVKKEDES